MTVVPEHTFLGAITLHVRNVEAVASEAVVSRAAVIKGGRHEEMN